MKQKKPKTAAPIGTRTSAEKTKQWSAAKLAAGHISHDELLEPMRADTSGGDLPFLGHARAVVIVTFCAKTTPANLSRTLAELGVDGIAFQSCVFEGIRKAGYRMDIDDIPDSSDTTLIRVVFVIQNAPRASEIEGLGRLG